MATKEDAAEIENFGGLMRPGPSSSVGEGVTQKFPQWSKNHGSGHTSIVDVVNDEKATPRIFMQRRGSLALSNQERWDECLAWIRVDLNVTLGSPGSTGTEEISHDRNPVCGGAWTKSRFPHPPELREGGQGSKNHENMQMLCIG
jgi:hypothetical protein